MRHLATLLSLLCFLSAGTVRAVGYAGVFEYDGITLDYSFDGVKLHPYDPDKDEVYNWNAYQVNVSRKYCLHLTGTVREGQTIYFEYTIDSDYKDWVDWLKDETEDHSAKEYNGCLYCHIDYPGKQVWGDSIAERNQRSYHYAYSYTIPEGTAGKWVFIHLNASYKEAIGTRSFGKQESAEHLAGVHVGLKIESLSNGKPLVETTEEASSSSGEDEGTEIPWILIIGGGIAVGAPVLAAARKKRKKNSGKDRQDKKEDRKKEPEKRHSTFRMILYKEFGNTLTLGDNPRKVGARIVEITPEGEQKERRDLTSQIQIDAEENCVARGAKMWGKHWAADVQAVKGPGGTVPETAKLRVVFFGAQGTFVNHVIFRVQDEPQMVMDEALTFAACSGKTLDMAFGINHFDEEVLSLTAEMDAAGIFKTAIEQDKEIPGKFVVHVTECGNKAMDAGDIDRYSCDVSVLPKNSDKPITGSFQVYRVGLGLSLDMRAIKAYLVEFDSTYDSERLATDPKVQKKFAESKLTFKLVTEDPETGEIRAVIPDQEPALTFEDIPEEGLLFRDKYGNPVPSPCGLMQLKYEFKDVDMDNTVIGVVHSTAGGLLPPNRSKAKVTLKVSWKGRTYEESIKVPVISQPFVDIADPREYDKWLNENQKKFEQMVDIRSKIAFDPRFNELLPFYYKVYALVEGYDPQFGIYEPDYQKIKRVFDKYCSGQIGHYFVNNSVWSPAWTEADENFNAFVATFGKMEKSIPVIGLRIALAYFTAGASELVLTPYSGLVKMQEYVNKGGDSAWEGFVVASKDVVFWEGVFYVGGKAFEYAKYRGWTDQVKDKAAAGWSKLKDGYKKLKDAATKGKDAKNATESLVKKGGHSTAGLGDKVKRAGDQVKHTKDGATKNANDAIRRTRQQGDKVFSKESIIAEECAKRARQDARKILDEFEAVMNNPTASPEEMRRAALLVQGNKTAQNLLRNHPSDMLRANFNAQMQEMYKQTDPLAIKKMAERLGVPESDIQVWNGATGNDARELYLGRKIAADRDVTFQVRDKNGNWVDIQESIMEECYAQAFDEIHYGFYSHSRKELLKTLHKYDQATVNGLEGAESYGGDLGRIIDKARQTEKLMDPGRVANTFKYKCEVFLKQGEHCRRQAEELFNAGLVDEAMRVQGYGEALIEEGLRQNVKQFNRILDPRIQAAIVKGSGKDYGQLYEKIRVLEGLGNPPPKDVLPCTLEEARLTLQSQYGCTIEDVINECANAIPEINAQL